MKKLVLIVAIINILPKNVYNQDDGAAVAAVAGGLIHDFLLHE